MLWSDPLQRARKENIEKNIEKNGAGRFRTQHPKGKDLPHAPNQSEVLEDDYMCNIHSYPMN